MASAEERPTVSPVESQTTASTSTGLSHLRQKRARSQLSCTPCRQGKLKCDRNRDPACDQCIKRNKEAACTYVPPPVRAKTSQNVKGRIRQLESLVVDLMNTQNKERAYRESRAAMEKKANQRGSFGGKDSFIERGDRSSNGASQDSSHPSDELTPPSDNDSSSQWTNQENMSANRTIAGDIPDSATLETVTKPFGQMKISRNEIAYVGESHWQAILDGISDLQRDLADEGVEDADDGGESWGPEDSGVQQSPEAAVSALNSVCIGGTQPQATSGLGFLMGASQSTTKDQLIQSVPGKRVADRLLSLWFNSPDPFKPIIHAPTFQEEYRRFWRNPQSTPVMWMGLLFAILSLAESFGLRDNDPQSPAAQACLERVNRYHALAASAAVLADFTNPKQYTMECLILYTAGLRSNNAFVNVWLMLGLTVRLGLRMGYHRDPSHYPNISPFAGEMRRRVWASISMIDVLISFQLGLPSMVRTINSDTAAPRNLLDRDFNVTSTVIPPDRGVDELTPASYVRAKLSIIRIFAQAAELSHVTVKPADEEVMRLDRELEQAKAAVPPLLQMPDISELVTDPAEQLMCRFNLDLLYLKTKTVLHRRYMLIPLKDLSAEEQARGIGVSRKNCIECALRVLQHHQTIYHMSQPSGQLESVKWYMGSISTHDFLLAAMVLCVELAAQIQPNADPPQKDNWWCPRRQSMMETLDSSQKIWAETSARNRAARSLAKSAGTDGSSVTATSGNSIHTANVWKPGGTHFFDEVDKASHAMSIMIERVRAQFPEPRFQNLNKSRGPIDSADDVPNGALGQGKELQRWDQSLESVNWPSQAHGAAIDPSPSAFASRPLQWDAGPGLFIGNQGTAGSASRNMGLDATNSIYPSPDSGTITSSISLVSETGGGVSLPTGLHTDDAMPDQAQQDFNVIGNMLDMGMGMNIDWDSFDTTTLGVDGFSYESEEKPFYSVENGRTSAAEQHLHDQLNFGAFSSRQGPPQNEQSAMGFPEGMPVRAGNALVGMGTGPGSNDFARFVGTDWDLDVRLEDYGGPDTMD